MMIGNSGLVVRQKLREARGKDLHERVMSSVAKSHDLPEST